MLYTLSNAIANIKNGFKTKKIYVGSFSNSFTKRVLQKLIYEGFLRGFSIDPNNFYKLRIYLKYDENYQPVIRNLKIISTSGKRIYFTSRQVLEAYQKGDYFIISTSKGLFSVNELVYNRYFMGGEVILQIFFY